MTRVRLFASLRELAGASEVEVEGADSVGAVVDRLIERYGERFAAIARAGSVVVDGERARPEQPLAGAREVAILPPVSGGSHDAPPPRPQRVLLVVNPAARSVTPALVELIEKALAADFKLDVHETNARGHATEIAADAVAHGTDMIVVFSGDGTTNEVANALVHTPVSLGLIPGGATNVLARGLGIPDDPIEATVGLIHQALEKPPRRIALGRVNGRHFTFACGVGLDAAAMAHLDERKGKLRTRRSYEWAALSTILRKGIATYAGRDADLTLRIHGEEIPAISVLIGNAHPYAYFKRWPLKVTPEARAAAGLDVLSARKLTRRGVPRLVFQLFVTGKHVKGKNFDYRHDVTSLEIVGKAPFPVQVDGDYLGKKERLEVVSVPDALWVQV